MSAPHKAGGLLATLLLAGCASTPVHYHTLVAPLPDAETADALSAYRIDVASVTLPAEVDRPELVVRGNLGSIALLEDELWAAPPAEEVRAALAYEIRRRADRTLCAEVRRKLSSLWLEVDIERFESVAADHALVQAHWRLRVTAAGHDAQVSRRSRASRSVGAGYDSLVVGYQRVLREIAGEIADAATEALAQGGFACQTG